MSVRNLAFAGAWLVAAVMSMAARGADPASTGKPCRPDVKAILEKPLYKNGVWGLYVVDLDTGEVIYDLAADRKFMTGSVRKVVSVGLALDKMGPDHKFVDAYLSSRHVERRRARRRFDSGGQR